MSSRGVRAAAEKVCLEIYNDLIREPLMSRCFPVRRLYVLTRFRETIRRVSLRGSPLSPTTPSPRRSQAGQLRRRVHKGYITHAHLLASETTGALTPEVIRLLHVLDTSSLPRTRRGTTPLSTASAAHRPSPPSRAHHPPRCRLTVMRQPSSQPHPSSAPMPLRSATTQHPWPLPLLTASRPK